MSNGESDMGLFSNAKDRLTERAALAYLNSKLLTPYGQATHLRIDSSAKTISIETDLKGESSPLQIEITGYQLSKEGERYFVTASGIRTSREWLTKLAEDHVVDMRFEVPEQVGKIIATAL